jgi:hypothetical protein
MLCMNVTLNGQHLAVAGLPGFGLLGTTVSLSTWKLRRGKPIAKDGANLSIHGLDMNPRGRGVHLMWDQRALTLGDEVLIRVVENENPDSGTVVTDSPEEKHNDRRALKVFLEQRKAVDAEIARLRREIQKRKPRSAPGRSERSRR